MKNNARIGVTWLTLVVFILFMIIPGYPAQNKQEKKGLKLIKEGEAHYDNFNFEKAVDNFKEAVKLLKNKDDLIRAYLNLSKTYYALADKIKTEKSLEQMFELKPAKPIDEEKLPRGYLKIYQRVSNKYMLKYSVSPRDKTVKEIGVIEKPVSREKFKKKRFPWVIVIVGAIAVAALIILLTKKSKNGNGELPDPNDTNGAIAVLSTPSGATIWLDGNNTGKKTDDTLENVAPGSHNVRLILPGYEDYETTVTVVAGQQASVSATLQFLLGIDWKEIPAGEFPMGDDGSESETNEKPVHNVNLSGYYISKYEITFSQYDTFCDETGRSKPSDEGWGRANRPVVNISWDDAKAFCVWLSGKSGKSIHLPTEAQWEKAARGTDQRRYPWGNSDADCNKAHYLDCGGGPKPVGSFEAGKSQYGVYDMAGNVYEWCQDWYDASYYNNSSHTDPQGPSSGSEKIRRGGGWNRTAKRMRCAARHHSAPGDKRNFIGFRVSMELN